MTACFWFSWMIFPLSVLIFSRWVLIIKSIAKIQQEFFFTYRDRCRRWLDDWLLRPPVMLSLPPLALTVTRDDIFDFMKTCNRPRTETKIFFFLDLIFDCLPAILTVNRFQIQLSLKKTIFKLIINFSFVRIFRELFVQFSGKVVSIYFDFCFVCQSKCSNL